MQDNEFCVDIFILKMPTVLFDCYPSLTPPNPDELFPLLYQFPVYSYVILL